jgi:hypothetical protein
MRTNIKVVVLERRQTSTRIFPVPNLDVPMENKISLVTLDGRHILQQKNKNILSCQEG